MSANLNEETQNHEHQQDYKAPSVCPLDCPDACSLNVEVKDGKIHKIKGSNANPMTKGVICGKVSKYYPDFVHGKHRLTTPLKRIDAKGGDNGSTQFEPISWDEALDLCYEGMQKGILEYGPESVMPLNYAGPHGQLSGGSMDMRFFYKLGATQLDRSPLCAGVRGLSYRSLFGNHVAMSQEQAVYSDLIVLWGTNTSTTYLHLMKIIKKAKDNGAKVIVINPERIKVARSADLFLQVTPGTDAYFALAMASQFDKLGMIDKTKLIDKVSGVDEYLENASSYSIDKLAEICGINQSQADTFIELFRNAKRISMQTGVGLERSKNGGSAIRSAMSLAVLLGQFGQKGQGQIGYHSPAYPKTTDKLQRPDLLEKPTRTFNIVDTADHILGNDIPSSSKKSPISGGVPIKSVFIYNHNPVLVHPDQNKMIEALSKEDVFVIGCEINMTDSMQYADVILPACSSFEHDDVYLGYGHNYAQRAEAAIQPVGNALPNTEIFRRLSKRFGFTDALFSDTDAELQEQALDLSSERFETNKVSEISTHSALSTIDKNHVWLSDMADDEKITLYNEDLENEFGYGLPRYESIIKDRPFTLVTAAAFNRSNSTFGGNNTESEKVSINVNDASTLNIKTGDKVKLHNNKGEVVLIADVNDTVAAGVLYTPKGAWCESSPTGQTVNALIDSHSKTDIGNGAAFYDTYVDLSVI
ncbi:molybdopterin oxidoreductase family protein [Cocleimonas flava]|uniref:Anaerobic selenocysteine-containing dehydrogenase n=1 Tax=Cocleimonas flava TaxID=634765 RepID=A0A4R1EYM5_9GAMM|nr:molybdopterin-dependent oxidoreductase [Cocleimonas flava]TCJ86947.1 anaerobic selenocysteine-containing dehydrogenase [Cocleimonas flava]